MNVLLKNAKTFVICVFAAYLCLVSHAFSIPPDSLVVLHHANGKISEKGLYRNGLKHHRWMYYDQTGKMLLKEKWKNGALEWKVEYENGKVSKLTDKKGNVRIKSKCGC